MVFPAKSKTRQNQQKVVWEKKKNQRKKFCHDFQSPDLGCYDIKEVYNNWENLKGHKRYSFKNTVKKKNPVKEWYSS